MRRKARWSLPPPQLPDMELLIPLSPGDSNVLCSRGNSAWAPGWGLVTRKIQPQPASEVEAPPHPLGQGLEAELTTAHACKLLKHGVQIAYRVVDTPTYWEGRAPQLHRDRSFCTWHPPRPRPGHLLLWPLSWVLHDIHKTVSLPLSSVSCSSTEPDPRRE